MKYKEFNAASFDSIPPSNKINALILDGLVNANINIYVFKEKEGVFSCLLPVKQTTEKLPILKGLEIQYQQFKIPGLQMEWFVLIECRTSAYLINFTQIVREIIEEIDKGKNETVKCVNLIVSRWRYFLSEPSARIMEEADIIGLIGELIFLNKLIEEYGIDAISFWVADKGEIDFIKKSISIEVKTTLKGRHEHVINGIDQLLILPKVEKKILSLLIIKSNDNNAQSINAFIELCSSRLSEYPETFDDFYKKLKIRGYDLRDSELYDEFKIICFKGGYFKVDNSFPRLTSNELIQPLNPRISKVRYTIDMEGLENQDFFTTPINTIL